MNMSVLLWGYLALVVAGGCVGFLKAGSKISLVASIVSAMPLAAVALKALPLIVAQVEMGFLVLLFASRWAKTRKPMPGAPMILLTLAALAATWFVKA